MSLLVEPWLICSWSAISAVVNGDRRTNSSSSATFIWPFLSISTHLHILLLQQNTALVMYWQSFMNFCTFKHLQTTKLKSLHALPLVKVVSQTTMLTSLVVKRQLAGEGQVSCYNNRKILCLQSHAYSAMGQFIKKIWTFVNTLWLAFI
jgi:hypothetical protein